MGYNLKYKFVFKIPKLISNKFIKVLSKFENKKIVYRYLERTYTVHSQEKKLKEDVYFLCF